MKSRIAARTRAALPIRKTSFRHVIVAAHSQVMHSEPATHLKRLWPMISEGAALCRCCLPGVQCQSLKSMERRRLLKVEAKRTGLKVTTSFSNTFFAIRAVPGVLFTLPGCWVLLMPPVKCSPDLLNHRVHYGQACPSTQCIATSLSWPAGSAAEQPMQHSRQAASSPQQQWVVWS